MRPENNLILRLNSVATHPVQNKYAIQCVYHSTIPGYRLIHLTVFDIVGLSVDISFFSFFFSWMEALE